jgi:hypothetical protein
MLHLYSDRNRSKLLTCLSIKKEALAISVTRLCPGINISAQIKPIKYVYPDLLKFICFAYDFYWEYDEKMNQRTIKIGGDTGELRRCPYIPKIIEIDEIYMKI